MKTHQLNFAIDGKHWFRTDWMTEEEARDVAKAIKAALPHVEVSALIRDVMMHRAGNFA